MQRKKVLMIVGSLRERSLNKQLAQAAMALLDDVVDTELLQYSDVPFMNQDIERPAPEQVNRIRRQVRSADALWIITPEYNHAIPGVLKNLIDWLSRPEEYGEATVVAGKPVTISGAAGGSGSSYALKDLEALLSLIKMDVIDVPATAVCLDRETFTTDVLRVTDDIKYSLNRQAKALLVALSRLLPCTTAEVADQANEEKHAQKDLHG